MHARYPIARALGALLLAVLGLFGPQSTQRGLASGPSYHYTWKEGDHLFLVEYWNASSRAGCDYAANPWPQAALAYQRAYVLATRQVFRDEWNISAWVTQNRAANSEVHIHGAETNCFDNHADWPPHVHAFYVSPDSSGNWRLINAHNYTSSTGKVNDTFIIPGLCTTSKSYHPAADAWVDILDETCSPAWQQRRTSAGNLEFRRGPTAPIYTLRPRTQRGDLAGVDILLNGQTIYNIDVDSYDAVGMRMTARIRDYRRGLLITETWWGDPVKGINLAGHTVQSASVPRPALSRRIYLPMNKS